ncbi:MAG TPA: STAS domain-containing protein [Myxococcales bacterium]|jgi:rsbT co-antagonist protein RsbR
MPLNPKIIQEWAQSLDRFSKGEFAQRLSGADEDPALANLRAAMNACLDQSQAREESAHAASMELAMGLSDCFSVLTEVKRGRLDVEVSQETLKSTEELVCRLGEALNDAVRGLRDVRELSERQQVTIRELSTPVLQVWEGIIVLPLIGVVDTHRATDIMEKVLRSIGELAARFVILDLTGVDTVDTKTADHIMKVVRAAQLLGARCMLTGIQPAVAQTLVEVGVELQGFKTLRNLQAGLRACLREMQEAK